MPRVFLVTGTSTGFGYELVKRILAEGDIAVATARDSSKLRFDSTSPENFLAVDLDVTKPGSIDAAFDKALSQFDRIDVVVNNAGYGLSGPFETLSDKQLRMQMDVNFFGLLDVTRRALEVMRERNSPRGGLIQQVTSIGGQLGYPAFSLYCASKWAVEGFTEALSKEVGQHYLPTYSIPVPTSVHELKITFFFPVQVKPEWDIHLQLVEPGAFRTDWSGRSMNFGEVKNEAYDHIDAEKNAVGRHGKQPGDPAKGARAMYELATMSDPPLRCVIGSDAHRQMLQKMETYSQEIMKFETLSNSTDVDN